MNAAGGVKSTERLDRASDGTCPVPMQWDGKLRCGRTVHRAPQGVDPQPVCLMHSNDPAKAGLDLYKSFLEILGAILMEAGEGRANLCKFVFSRLDLSSFRLSCYCDFSGAVFTQDVKFEKTTFLQGANFGKVTFEQGANFADAMFSKGMNFQAASFQNEADFQRARFEQGANFKDAVFEGAANLEYAKFGGAGFMGTAFKREARFSETRFTDVVTFFEAKFADATSFAFAEFEDNVNYSAATFGKRVSWFSSKFRGAVTFRGTQFSSDVADAPSAIYRWAEGRALALAETLLTSTLAGLFFLAMRRQFRR